MKVFKCIFDFFLKFQVFKNSSHFYIDEFETYSDIHHKTHLSFGFILEFSLQLKASEKLLKLESGTFILYFPGL
jgi:hypothetical protein